MEGGKCNKLVHFSFIFGWGNSRTCYVLNWNRTCIIKSYQILGYSHALKKMLKSRIMNSIRILCLIFNNARTSITLTKEEVIILFPIGIHCIFSLTASKTQSTKSTIFAKLCWGVWNYTSMRKVAYKAFNSNTVLISFIGSGDSLWKATNRREFCFPLFHI